MASILNATQHIRQRAATVSYNERINKLIISQTYLSKLTTSRSLSSSSLPSRRFNPFSHEPYIIPQVKTTLEIDDYNLSTLKKYRLAKNQSFRDLLHQVINYDYKNANNDGTVPQPPLTAVQLAKYEFNSIRKLSVRLGGPYRAETKDIFIRNIEKLLIENTQSEEKRKQFKLRNELLTKSRYELQLLAMQNHISAKNRSSKLIDLLIQHQLNPPPPPVEASKEELEAKMGVFEYQAHQLSKRRTYRDLVKYCQSVGIISGTTSKIDLARCIFKHKEGKLEKYHYHKRYLKRIEPIELKHMTTINIQKLARMLGLVFKGIRHEVIDRIVRHQRNQAEWNDYLINFQQAKDTMEMQSTDNTTTSSSSSSNNNNNNNIYQKRKKNKTKKMKKMKMKRSSRTHMPKEQAALLFLQKEFQKEGRAEEPLLLRALMYDMLVHLSFRAGLPITRDSSDSNHANTTISISSSSNSTTNTSSNHNSSNNSDNNSGSSSNINHNNDSSSSNINHDNDNSSSITNSSSKDASSNSNNNSSVNNTVIAGIADVDNATMTTTSSNNNTEGTTNDISSTTQTKRLEQSTNIQTTTTTTTTTATHDNDTINNTSTTLTTMKFERPEHNATNLTRSELIQQLMHYLASDPQAVLDTPSLVNEFKIVRHKYVRTTTRVKNNNEYSENRDKDSDDNNNSITSNNDNNSDSNHSNERGMQL